MISISKISLLTWFVWCCFSGCR